jgi:type 1 glutamine amidotransferase
MRILIYSRTAGYRHESIPAGVAALSGLGFDATASEDPAAIASLGSYAAVVFLNTSEDVLDDAGREELERYCRGGGGFVGVHCAAATEYGWPFYGELVGARFDKHPPVGPGVVRVEDADHPASAPLPAEWVRVDEWYQFRTDPRGRVRVLLAEAGTDHPLAWCHTNTGGRSFYTALGHTVESYREPRYLAHLAGGIRWAACR